MSESTLVVAEDCKFENEGYTESTSATGSLTELSAVELICG